MVFMSFKFDIPETMWTGLVNKIRSIFFYFHFIIYIFLIIFIEMKYKGKLYVSYEHTLIMHRKIN